jgi:hypothetical protein
MSFDYKNYSFENLENWMHDAMTSGEATPQEIYDVIVGVVKENYYYHKERANAAYELLALLNGNGKNHLSCDKDDPSEECKNSWDDFWENQYSEEQLDAMCDAAEAKDKIKTWVVPVDEDGVIVFPEDLMAQVGWKEGDILQWDDEGNGVFKLTKKEN